MKTANMLGSNIQLLFALLLPPAMAACGDDVFVTDDGGAEDGTGGCFNCLEHPDGPWSFDCRCDGEHEEYICRPSENEAQAEAYCQEWHCDLLPFDPDATVVEGVCAENQDRGTSCASWAPENEISLNTGTGVRWMEFGWIATVVDDPWQLWTCDNAFLTGVPGGGGEVNDADAGEMLYELGLRDGDIPLELNDMPLDTYADASAAYETLWEEGVYEYDLEVLRNSNVIHVYYEFAFTR